MERATYLCVAAKQAVTNKETGNMLSKLFSKKEGDDDKDDKNSQSAPPAEPPARPPATATPPAETPPNVQGGILRPPQKTEGNITVGRQKRITQRITVAITPPAPGARAGLKISLPSAKPAPSPMPAMPPVSGNLELPLSIIIPSLPAGSLKEPAEKLLEEEMAAKTASIPLATILGMLPLGKIEFPLKELANYLPAAGIFKATEEFGDEICPLPISEVVKRVPPELLTRRTDQKPIDEKVKKMADPFSPETILKETEKTSPLPVPPSTTEAPYVPAESIAAAMPPAAKMSPPEPSKELPIDLAALVQQAAGATEPIGTAVKPVTPEIPIEPSTPIVEDFAIPSEITTAPPPTLPDPSAETEKTDFAQSDILKSLEKEEPFKAKEIPSPEPIPPEILKETEASAPTFPFTPEKPVAPVSVPAPPPSSFEAEQKIPAGLESFSKVVEKLSPKEEKPVEPPKEEPKFDPPVFTPESEPLAKATSQKEEFKSAPAISSLSTKVNLNQCTSEELVRQASCPEAIARKIIAWRELHGSFTDLHFLWNIPGMTTEVYRLLTGLPDEESAVELNEIFGMPADAHLTVKDVATRIRSWPFMNGCIISGMEGLPIAFDCDDKKFAKAICAFAPKLLQQTHDILEEINEPEAHEIHLMQEDKTISIFRYEHLILITINRRKGLSSRDVELLRQVVVKLSNVKGAKLEV